MNLLNKIIFIATAISLIGSSSASFARGDRTRLECTSHLVLEDASARARFEARDGRAKFNVEVEARPGGSFQAGDVLRVSIDGEIVGNLVLEQGAVDLITELEFDTDLEPGDTELPFPANFPPVSAGSVVQVGAQFACDLQDR